MKISYYYGGAFDKTPIGKEVIDCFSEIKNGKHKKRIETCRKKLSEGDKNSYNDLKRRIPAITVSCRANGRKLDSGIEEYSGLLQGDFDNVSTSPFSTVEETRDTLANDRHVVASYISPSGRGVKIWIAVVKDATKHKDSFVAAEKYFKEKYKLELDPACSDITRLCFQSYDPDAKYKETAEPIPLEAEEFFFDATQQIQSQERDDYERVRLALDKVAHLADDYESWYKVGMSVKFTLHGEGFEMWDDWSKKSPKYNASEMVSKWKSFSGGEIEGGTLFHLAGETFKHKPLDSVPKNFQEKKKDLVLHKDYYNPPGFVGDLSKLMTDYARYPQPELALAASLAYTGTLLGQRVRTVENIRTNLFCVGIGKTGSGKEFSRMVIKMLDEQANLQCFAGEKVTSRSAIERCMDLRPTSLFLIDEFGLFLKSIFSENASRHLSDCVTCWMELYSSAQSTFYGVDRASTREVERVVIVQPSCSIYGTTTGTSLWSSLNSDKINDGSANRFIFWNSTEERPPRKEAPILDMIPEPLLIKAKSYRELSINPGETGNIKDTHGRPKPLVVDYTPESKKLFNKYEDLCEKLSESSDLTSSMWVRTPEHARKLALITAFSGGKEQIDAEATEWAVELTQYLNHRAIKDIQENLADNLNERLSKKVEAIIRRYPEGIENWQLTRNTRFLSPKQRGEILEDLRDSNIIVAVEEKTKTIPKIKWFAKQ